MKFQITPLDIKDGVCAVPGNCALARAIRRRFPDSLIRVSGRVIIIDDKRYPTSKKIVLDFDLNRLQYRKLPITVEIDDVGTT